jgi:ATPase
MQIVPDTSAIIDRRIADGYLRDAEVEAVLIPEVVVGELEAQANADRESGWDGLAEIESIRAADVTVRFVGERQSSEAIAAADAGSIDAIVREIASAHDATLITSDAVQAAVARAMGAAVEYIEPIVQAHDRLELQEYFDEETMSVHLKTGVRPKAKRGAIGEMQYEFIGEQPLGEHTVRSLAQDVRLTARANPAGFIEMNEPGMEVIQFEDYRIAIARPPFADAIEITAVRPIVKTDLTDYEFADELRGRLEERQRGVLIAGAPGAGKSTFAQAVAEFLNEADYAVKTMEKPRDLQVTDEVTQYTALGGSMAKTAGRPRHPGDRCAAAARRPPRAGDDPAGRRHGDLHRGRCGRHRLRRRYDGEGARWPRRRGPRPTGDPDHRLRDRHPRLRDLQLQPPGGDGAHR